MPQSPPHRVGPPPGLAGGFAPPPFGARPGGPPPGGFAPPLARPAMPPPGVGPPPFARPPPFGAPPGGGAPFAAAPPPADPPQQQAAPPAEAPQRVAPPPFAVAPPPTGSLAGLSLGAPPNPPFPHTAAPQAGHAAAAPPPAAPPAAYAAPPAAYGAPPPLRAYPTSFGGATSPQRVRAAAAPARPRADAPQPVGAPSPPPLHAPGAPLLPPVRTFGAPPSPPGAPAPGSPAGVARVGNAPSTPSGARIDPAQIPRPSYAAGEAAVQYDTRAGGVAVPPPPANAAYCARDCGNASPRFLRLSMHCLPSSPDLLASSGMPLGVVAQPLALAGEGEEEVPLVDPGPEGPVRCAKCRAYMCAHHRWLEGGRAWSCALCGARNEARRDDVCALAADGRRADAGERAELCRGSVEYAAGEAYSVRAPMLPSFLFLIDCSPAALQSGFTACACDAAKRALAALSADERARAGVASFDCAPHFYRLRARGEPACMLVVADAQEPHCPVPRAAGLLAPARSHGADLEALLDSLPDLFAAPRAGAAAAGDSCAGAALHAAVETLGLAGGGRLLAFLAAPPACGWGAPLPRTQGGDAEPLRSLCPPESKPYAQLAASAAEKSVCVDLFLAGGAAAGEGVSCAAVLGGLARGTGGGVAAYPSFAPALDHAQLANDVRWAAARPQGLEAVARLRVAAGVSVAGYSGSLATRGEQGEGEDVELPALDCDKAFSAQLRLEERRAEGGGEFVVQLALLYTTPGGARRIRVHSTAVPVVASLAALFRAADLDCQLALACRGAAAELLRGKLSAAALRERSLADAVAALHAYRRFCASNSAAGQLILPEALKLLPLHGLGLSKGAGLRPGASFCERATWALQQLAAPAAAAAPACYPRLFQLSELGELAPGQPLLRLPPTAWLSSERLESDGAALVEDGRCAVLHVGPRAPPELLEALFADQPCGSAHPLPALDTGRSRALHALLNAVRKQRGAFMRLRVVRRPDVPSAEAAFFSMLVEDRSAAGSSYVEHLCTIHRAIQGAVRSTEKSYTLRCYAVASSLSVF